MKTDLSCKYRFMVVFYGLLLGCGGGQGTAILYTDTGSIPDVWSPPDATTGNDGGENHDDVVETDSALLFDAELTPDLGQVADLALDPDVDLHKDVADDPEPSASCVEESPQPWSRSIAGAGGTVVFNEVMYRPAGDAVVTWVELHNPFSIDMDISGWRLDGAIYFPFPDGTMIPPGEYLVISSDPTNPDLGDATVALGPWSGTIPPTGGTLELYSNSDRLMDTMKYTDDYPWPVTAAGSGSSLAKVTPTHSSELAEEWRGSGAPGGTPGTENFPNLALPPTWTTLVPDDAVWAYLATGEGPPANWPAVAFDDAGWLDGPANFFAGAPLVTTQTIAARFTADNFFALYTGAADGAGLTLIGRDAIGDWSAVEDFTFDVDPNDHAYVAAWEAPGGDGGPQMLIGELALPDGPVTTSASEFQWTLGPADGSPGGSLSDSPPGLEEMQGLIETANDSDSWAPPAAEADKSSNPWSWAVAGSFDSDAKYIWSDTFDSLSMTNSQQTYALFRTVKPLLHPPGETEISQAPITTYFRTEFMLPPGSEQLTLWLSALVEDGAVFYLNGVEVLRLNMPDGPVGPDTPAAQQVAEPNASTGHQLPAALLQPGVNVLAAEVHQAEAGDGTMAFGAQLMAQVWPAAIAGGGSGVRFNEAAAGGAGFWLELTNTGSATANLEEMTVASADGAEAVLPTAWLEPGELAVVSAQQLGFDVEAGAVLFLYSASKAEVLDGVRISPDPQARLAGDGEWFFPGPQSPGLPNAALDLPSIVINEVMYNHAPAAGADGTDVESNEEWIELHNLGAMPVDLGGWSLVDAIEYQFPPAMELPPGGFLVVARDAAAFAAAHPDVTVLGSYAGKLANSYERLVLRDLCGNVVDQVRYFEGGSWPAWADGGGSTIELRDPRADNSRPEAWGASIEPGIDGWETVVIEGLAEPSAVGPDGTWHELILGLLDDGVVLVDDVSLLEDPQGMALERVQNGNFEATGPAGWRLLGNHRKSEVIVDPADTGNHVLRIAATGNIGHMHNHIETTLAGGAPITNGTTYRLSFRARWVAGCNKLNSRLYFNRLAETTVLSRPPDNGTPGLPNSVMAENIGPTYFGLSHWPAVPAPGEPVTVTVAANDPDGVAELTLYHRVDNEAPQGNTMSHEGERYVGQISGAPANSVVQFWVQGIDGVGNAADFPAAGPDSRALFKVDYPPESPAALHTLRIIVTAADDQWLFTPENLMSDHPIGATVIWDESEVFYDVGLRLKGSERGRPQTVRVGYAVKFRPDQPFHGVYSTVMVDRSEGVGFGQREMLINLMMARAGAVSSEYSDLIKVIAPRKAHTGPAELQLTRFGDQMLDFQFKNGGDGSLYEYEYIYYPTTTTDGSPESPKLPQPDSVVGTSIKDIGADKEAYRFIYLTKNNRAQDNYDDLIPFAQSFGQSGPAFLEQAGEYIDVDQWLRAFALAALPGAIDHYGNGSGHNAMFYVRPSDQRVLYFPHDLDFFPGSPNNAVVANQDLARLIASPENGRIFYGHLLEIMQTSYNGVYMGHWCEQLGELLPAQNFAGHLQFIVDRAAWVLGGAPDSILQAIPQVAFEIATNGGADIATEAPAASLAGHGWVDVQTIWRQGDGEPLPLAWTHKSEWVTSVPLVCGPNPIVLEAHDHAGNAVGTDSILVTLVGEDCP